MSRATLIQGDAREQLSKLPDASVHCMITSPPYWGLRDYGVEGMIGLEQTFEEFLSSLMLIFDQVHRVLRPDGTIWVNMGDSYNSAFSRGYFGAQGSNGAGEHGLPRPQIKGMHEKNLIGQPWRLAFALQDRGWILRSEIIWYKTNPMPSSIQDRPTPAHETLFLLSKSPRYYYDQLAIREPASRAGEVVRMATPKYASSPGSEEEDKALKVGDTRNKWDVWPIPSEPFSEAHFATFPTKLVEPCILAGTSAYGCCADCRAPYVRKMEVDQVKTSGKKRKRADAPGAVLSESSALRTGSWNTYKCVGWEKSCHCSTNERAACVVLDPFNGSGTTGEVALKFGRDYIGIELNPEYLAIAERRISSAAPLLNIVEVRRESA